MGEIVNLRQARKTKMRAEKERLAETNRARFGRTKTERKAEAAEAQKLAQRLEQARREPSDRSDED